MNALPDLLLRPGVELRETHISWVFLSGEQALKVKKPVTFGFVDYGSLERRRAFCRAELELNRRFAPDVYLRVAGLRADGSLTAEDDPDAVEYAVVMRRYDEGATLAARLAAGATAVDLTRAGAAVAAFHAAAPQAEGGDLGAVVEESLASLAASGAPAARVEALGRFYRAALSGLGAELDERAARGLVRDGHGDLRAEHILLEQPIAAVDALEFDPALRIADVGYDFAFLAMDAARTDDALARALVRGYRGAGGDPGSDALFTFFCSLRALVRAKVDMLRAGQLKGGAAQERGARAQRLLALAERFAWRARLPRLVCVTGLPASGKSTVAEALAGAAGRPVLSSDRVRKLRAGIDPYERARPEDYGDAQSRAVYAELAQRAAAAVREEGGAIVDATFRRGSDADAFAGGSRAAAGAAWIVCEAPPEVLLERARARERHASVSDAGPEIVAGELAVFRGRFDPPGPPLARLDTTRPIAEGLAGLAEALDARLARPEPARTR